MIVIRYTEYNKETKEPKYSYEVIENEDSEEDTGKPNKTFKEVLQEVEKRFQTEETKARRIEVIEYGFVLHKNTVRPRKVID